MDTISRNGLRFLLVASALALLPALVAPLVGPTTPPDTPYASALAGLGPTPVHAAGCQFKACQFVNGRITCKSTTEAENCKSGRGFCEVKPCPA